MSWIKDLKDIFFPVKTGIGEMTDAYLKTIKFLKDEIDEQRKIISDYKKKHPDNGKELDQWLAREEENYRRIVELLQQNRDLREENIFLKKENESKKK